MDDFLKIVFNFNELKFKWKFPVGNVYFANSVYLDYYLFGVFVGVRRWSPMF